MRIIRYLALFVSLLLHTSVVHAYTHEPTTADSTSQTTSRVKEKREERKEKSALAGENASQTSETISQTTKTFWDRGVGRFLKKIDNKLKEWEHSGIDTNYVRVPERDRYVYLGSYGYYQQHTMQFPILLEHADYPTFLQPYIPANIAEKSYINACMHTFQTEGEVGLDWRGVTIEIPISISNKYSRSFGLAKNGIVWGFRVRYKHLQKMNGRLDDAYNQTVATMAERLINEIEESGGEDGLKGDNSPVETTTHPIGKDELDLKTFYTEAYYVFNHTKFSLAAGMYADMVQRRPAGSLFVMANYYQSQLKCNNLFNYDHDRFRTSRLSFGAGYGYNLPFMDGRLCFHLSAIPMLSVLNRVTHSGWLDATDTPSDVEDALSTLFEAYNQHYYDACRYGRDSAFRVNLFGRFAVNYSFHRYLISLLANYRQYLFGASSGLKIADRELDIQLNFGWRF